MPSHAQVVEFARTYADAMGYFLSLKHNVRFLTGDKAFRDLENVEFLQ